MAIATVKGWKTCVGVDQFQVGDKCVYFPPETVIPDTLADRLGVKKYLCELPKDAEGKRPASRRIRVARLRGFQSYGLVIKCENSEWEVGHDVAEHYECSKFEPPQVCTDGDAETPLSIFHRYTDIENFRNFPDVIKEGEEVVFTEKIHGKNARLGYLRIPYSNGEAAFEFVAGSHDVRRKEYMTLTKVKRDEFTKEPLLDADGQPITTTVTRRSQFWDCFTEEAKSLLKFLSRDEYNVILFGEMYGRGVQDMHYGSELGFRVFDISVEGQYLDFPEKDQLLKRFGVPGVPVLYRGPFSKLKLEEFVDGPTTLCAAENAGTFKGREGVVITPIKERTDFNLGGSGRVILKAVSFFYLERKEGTEYH
jgi:RNA ligase (TIGR02306 family)